jgi:hypothetical protein
MGEMKEFISGRGGERASSNILHDVELGFSP